LLRFQAQAGLALLFGRYPVISDVFIHD
jgi:hypothetical protein